MLFMVIERFRDRDFTAVGERFAARGRMLPDGVSYRESWVGVSGDCCYQVVEAPDSGSLDHWIAIWGDLVDFEVVPIVASADFWAEHLPEADNG